MKTAMIRGSLSLCVLASIIVSCSTKPAPVPNPTGEVREPRKWDNQYKRISLEGMAELENGKVDEALDRFQAYLAEHSDDLESMYGLAVAWTQKGDLDRAMHFVRQAVDAGLPFGRFLAGPRPLLKPLRETPEFQAFASEMNTELVHGPMLGCVTDTSAKFWVRTAHEVPVQVEVQSETGHEMKSDKVQTREDLDYTAVASVDGLKPETRYFYRVRVNNSLYPEEYRFRTFPQAGAKTRFQVGFGGGAGYTPDHERMWSTIRLHELPAFLFLGDNVYIDHPKHPLVQKYCYYRRQSRPEYRAFVPQTSIFAIWDDHDFVDNDGRGGPQIDQPAWKIPVWRVFKNNWNNPSYGGGESQPGCWFTFSLGDVDFFMLDGRYYREDPKKENASMLGPVQKRWFLNALADSKAKFKVLASPVPWSYNTKPGSLDTWDGYAEEREEIFAFIEDNKIDGVIFISADRHRSDVWKIERPDGYDFYEFESSRLTNIHRHGIMKGSVFGYNEKCSFGILSFDFIEDDPSITYHIYNIDNELIYTFPVRLSDLSFPE